MLKICLCISCAEGVNALQIIIIMNIILIRQSDILCIVGSTWKIQLSRIFCHFAKENGHDCSDSVAEIATDKFVCNI